MGEVARRFCRLAFQVAALGLLLGGGCKSSGDEAQAEEPGCAKHEDCPRQTCLQRGNTCVATVNLCLQGRCTADVRLHRRRECVAATGKCRGEDPKDAKAPDPDQWVREFLAEHLTRVSRQGDQVHFESERMLGTTEAGGWTTSFTLSKGGEFQTPTDDHFNTSFVVTEINDAGVTLHYESSARGPVGYPNVSTGTVVVPYREGKAKPVDAGQ